MSYNRPERPGSPRALQQPPIPRDRLAIDAWLAELRRHVAVEDYSSALDDPAMFADRIHTNELGAAALIDQIADQLMP